MNERATLQPKTGNGIILASLILAEVHDRRWRWLALGAGAALVAGELFGRSNAMSQPANGISHDEERVPTTSEEDVSFEDESTADTRDEEFEPVLAHSERRRQIAVPRTIPLEHHAWDDLEPSGD